MRASKDHRDLVTVDAAAEAMGRFSGEMTRILDAMPDYAAAAGEAFAKDGVAGARAVLERAGRELRERAEAVTAKFAERGEWEADPIAEFPLAKQ